MPSLKTNYIRTQITSQCYRYQFQLISNQPIDSKYYHQIQGQFLSVNQYIVFNYPYIYSIDQLKQLKTFNFMLSNGQKLNVIILNNNTITLNSKQASIEIHKQLLKGTNFLYSQQLEICLNPFEERSINYSTKIMPGFSLKTEVVNACVGFYLIPLEAKITEFHSLSSLHEHSIILDYDSGMFYKKSSIVRYDKANEIIYFRTGQQLKKDSLKSLQISSISGFQLALKLTNYYKRIRQSQPLKRFIEKWQIKFDSRFMQIPYNFFPVSHILYKTQEKSLGQVIGSTSAYNFQYNFRRLFSNLAFDDSIRANIYFLLPKVYVGGEQDMGIDIESQNTTLLLQLEQQQQQFLLPIISQFQNIKLKMNLTQCKIQVFTYHIYPGWVNGMKKTIQQIEEFIQKEKQKQKVDRMFVMTNVEEMLRQDRENQLSVRPIIQQQESLEPAFKFLSKYFISTNTYYHIINSKQNQFKTAYDVIAIKSFSTILTKLRLNPWKIKQIPFGTKPLIVFSLYVKVEPNGSVIVSIVGSLNSLLSKYTSVVGKTTRDEYLEMIKAKLTQCLQKFKSIHKILPIRAMIFRTGDAVSSYQQQHQAISQYLIPTFTCKPTYILLTSSSSPLRVYNQIDFNYISKDTVKPTQLLCQLKYNSQRYLQLQCQSPLYKIKILGNDPSDPTFEEKVIELLTKLCFTYQIMTQMKFAKGLGFVDYGEKLYKWIQNNGGMDNVMIQKMEGTLRQGILMFL